MLVNIQGNKIYSGSNGIQSVTLAGTSSLVQVKAGMSFMVYNTGNAVMYIGPTAESCTVGLPIQSNSRDGAFISRDGNFYMRSTAGQTATIVYFEI